MAELSTRQTPPDAAEQVAALPRRTAHAAHALLATTRELGYGPLLASEIIVHDSEATSSHATGSALASACRYGLADRWGMGLWSPSTHARDLEAALEDRYLSDTEAQK